MPIRRSVVIAISASVFIWGQMPDAVGRNGMVVSSNKLASQMGVDVLKRGGNAVDAAIAVGFALAVTYPEAGNIGGGGFMVIRFADGRTTSIDFRERAPLAATKDMFLDSLGRVIPELSTVGILSTGVPGTVSGFAYAHEKYGSLNWSELVTPAARLAGSGFEVTYQLHRYLISYRDKLQQFAETRRVFYPNDEVPPLGSRFRQPDLAATLNRIAANGSKDFYHGKTARLLAEHMERTGGLITLEDLAAYRTVERQPIEFSYRNVRIISMPPPSSGGIALAQIFNQLERLDLRSLGYLSAEYIHYVAEAEKRTYADRAHYIGDPDFGPIPVESLMDADYAERRWREVSSAWATPSARISHGKVKVGKVLEESYETSHYSIVDRWGNAVSLTYTINDLFGSGEMVTGAGFLLNDEMDDFSARPGYPNLSGLYGSEANAIAPGKRMLSSMTPTIVTRNDSLYLVLGSRGGSRIITTVSQIIIGVVDFGYPVETAVEAPRFHHQWMPDLILAEPQAISPETRKRLERMGHKVVYGSGTIGEANCIMVDRSTGWYFGAADSRRESAAIGY